MTAHTSGSIAKLVGAELVGRDDLPVTHLDSVERAGPGALTFIRNKAFANGWAASKAVAALVTRGVSVEGHDPSTRALLIVDNADLSLQKVLTLLAPPAAPVTPGIHPSAVIDPGAKVGAGVSIGPGCVVEAGATLGDGVVLKANVVVQRLASVGAGTLLHAGVVIGERCSIGRACVFWPGVVIGSDGFGYLPDPAGRGVLKVPHIGTVEIGDMVEIGANSCVDRAKFGATVIGAGTKIDNLCQIAHNVRVGRACLICGDSSLAGSSSLGDGVILAGSVTVSDGVSVGSGAKVGGRSSVTRTIPPGEVWLGTPAVPAADCARNYAIERHLWKHMQELKHVQKELERRGIIDAPNESAAAAHE